MTNIVHPLGTMVAFYWQPSDTWLTGQVVDHLTFNGKVRHGVRVSAKTAVDPHGIDGGRIYDVWPDMSIAALTSPQL